jgi:hypothetical protein
MDWREACSNINYIAPTIEVEKELEVDPNESEFLYLLDVVDKDLQSKMDQFSYIGSDYYMCKDESWRALVDPLIKTGTEYYDNNFIFIANVIPALDELDYSDIDKFFDALVEGCKYYLANTMQSANDSQVSNLFYMRFYKKKEDIINRFDNKVFGYINETRRKKWP